MHSYYKKLVEEREVKLGEKRIMGPTSRRYKFTKTKIPSVPIPLTSFYRKNGFNIDKANPDERIRPSLNMSFNLPRNDEIDSNEFNSVAADLSMDQTFMTTKDNFNLKPSRILDNTFSYNAPQSISPKRKNSKLPELSLHSIDRNKRLEASPQNRGSIQMKPTRPHIKGHSVESHLLNPDRFKHTKGILLEKYDRVPPRDIQKMTLQLEQNRLKKQSKIRVGGLRYSTNDSFENMRIETFGSTNENFYNEMTNNNQTRKVLESRMSINPNRQNDSRIEILPERRKNSFEEDQLASQIEKAFKQEGDRIDKLRTHNPNRKLTLGDKYELLHKVNEKYLSQGVNQHRKMLQDLMRINR